jgi:anti-sigma-K factor RskA
VSIQEYISSGVIESYVLGLADTGEKAEFERMCAAHPEVRQAKEAFELSLEEYVMLNQVQPSAKVKSNIFSMIGLDPQQDSSQTLPGENRKHSILSPSASERVTGFARWQRIIAAASVILLVLSTALNFYFYKKYREYNERYDALVLSESQLSSNNRILETRLLEYEKAVDWMKNPDMAIIKMPAIPTSPDPSSITTVYWDKVSKDVYLSVSQLPLPAEDQQYQLWAMVDGIPVDAGVFDIKEGPGMTKMKNIPRAQAFAITLEKKGGNAKPSLDKLYVMGKV